MRLTYLTARRGVASRRTTPMELRLHERRSRRDAVACPGQPRHNLQPEERLHDQIRESLRKLWRKARPCQPPPSRPALLPQNLQGDLPGENSEGPCVHETVVWLRTSQGFAGDGRTGVNGPLARAVDSSRMFQTGRPACA